MPYSEDTRYLPIDPFGGNYGQIGNLWAFGSPTGNFPVIPMGSRSSIIPRVAIAPPEIFPTVVIQPPPTPTSVLPESDTGDDPVVFSDIIIDPEEAVAETVFETHEYNPVTGGFVRFPIPRQVNDPIVDEDVNVEIYPTGSRPVAIDWGDVLGSALGGIAGGIFDPVGIGSGVRGLVSSPTAGSYQAPGQVPAKVTVDTRTGAITACRRRRRRRLLTSSDLADLAALKAIIGGGAGMNAAVVKAVRR